MKSIMILLGSGLLATTLAVAQNTPSNSQDGSEPSPNAQTSKPQQSTNSRIRGCLSGSAGNYTITDQNGMQYTLAGPDNELQARVGHEVEVSTSRDTSSQGDPSAGSPSNTVQASGIRDVAATCKMKRSDGPASMNRDNADGPRTMAMLQQQSAPDAGTQEQKPGSAVSQQTTPPVSSQTPATSASPTASPQSSGNTDPSATAPAASNSSTTGPGTDATAPTSAAGSQGAQPSANDQNKPLYERQATDIPWASKSGDTTNTSNSPH